MSSIFWISWLYGLANMVYLQLLTCVPFLLEDVRDIDLLRFRDLRYGLLRLTRAEQKLS
jgi:hypothetical protein